MRKLSNTVATKEYVPNTLGNCFTFNNFFAWEHFYIDFLLFNKHFEHQDQVCKNSYQNASSRIVTFF